MQFFRAAVPANALLVDRSYGFWKSKNVLHVASMLKKSDICNNPGYMNIEKYELKSGEQLELFEFVSVGPKGRIIKLVQYSPTNYKDLFNLGFGDKNIETGEIDDSAISNNGDSEKVLATVVATLYAFTDKHRDALVYVTGSTKSRTRLYRMGVTKYFDEAINDFEIFGEINNKWEEFRKDVEYEGFIVKRKLN